ncbi:MAG: ABC transporter ATP-binding protein [Deltaproteobacteria bacterium]|nr:ABC transporter ATP-binding protein [Deltaproteobacteria bacterium]
MSGRDTVVDVEGLVQDFRPGLGLRVRRALDGVSFAVQRGEIFGFVGPNGAGKTTTLKILMGLMRASAGRARVLGHDVRETEYRRQIGFLPEAPYFYDYLTGAEFLAFYARVCGVQRARRSARIAQLLDWVGLAHAGDIRLRTYSKGMLQRIGIAQALIHDPQVVFLDEPMSGLDPIGRKEIRDLIRRLQGEGKTVFMNTHILSDVEMLCDRVAIIVKGRVRWEGAPHAIVADDEVEAVLTGVPVEQAERLATRLGARFRTAGERVELRVAQKELSAILGALLADGAQVLSVAPRRASLESIFLSAVAEGRA